VETSTDLVDLKRDINWDGFNDEGVCYFVTHIFTPQPAQVTLNIPPVHGQVFTGGQLNGTALPESKLANATQIDLSKPLSLQAGWNELVVREARIWGEGTFGVTLQADPAVLWKLKISGPAPATVH